MMKKSKNNNEVTQTFKSTIVLCCLIALCSATIGALGMYFYMNSQNVNDKCLQIED